jgi:hydroxypyruvate isomerase
MPKFAANLTLLFTEQPFLDRFEVAANAGFKGVEYLFPYDFEPAELKTRLDANGLEQVLHNLPAGDWAGGERGIAVLPDRVDEFREGVEQAVTYAKILGAPRLNCLPGILPDGADPAVARQTLVDNLKFAAARLAREDIKLVTEPVNTDDIPGMFLNNTEQAVAIIGDVGSDNLYLQYDIYHMQKMEGNLAATIEANLKLIDHIQLADNPGRHEPGTGEIDYPFLFAHLDALGYDGWIGCEYNPKGETGAGLGWLAEARQQAA